MNPLHGVESERYDPPPAELPDGGLNPLHGVERRQPDIGLSDKTVSLRIHYMELKEG